MFIYRFSAEICTYVRRANSILKVNPQFFYISSSISAAWLIGFLIILPFQLMLSAPWLAKARHSHGFINSDGIVKHDTVCFIHNLRLPHHLLLIFLLSDASTCQGYRNNYSHKHRTWAQCNLIPFFSCWLYFKNDCVRFLWIYVVTEVLLVMSWIMNPDPTINRVMTNQRLICHYSVYNKKNNSK